MPKPRSRKRWEHPSFRYAYCVERYGNVYTVVNGTPPMAIKGLKWSPENKCLAMEILHARIMETMQPRTEQRPATIFSAIELYAELQFPAFNHLKRIRVLNVFKKYLSEDLPLSNILEIKKHIAKSTRMSGCAHNTLRKHYQILSNFFDYCIDNDLMHKNPVAGSPYRAEAPVALDLPTRQELTQLLRYLNEHNREELADLIRLISLSGLRISEAMRLYWDEAKAPYIANAEHMRVKSIISLQNDMMIIDGKRHAENIANIREFPLSIIPGLPEHIEIMLAKPAADDGRLIHWTALSKPRSWLNAAVTALDLPRYTFHSVRTFATNWWEKELGIPGEICAYLGGHTIAVRDKFYKSAPTANELKNMLSQFELRSIDVPASDQKCHVMPSRN